MRHIILEKGASRNVALVVIAVIILVLGIYWFMMRDEGANNGPSGEDQPTDEPTTQDGPPPGWSSYTNGPYDFTIYYPSDWVVAEYPDDMSPMFNFYDPDTVTPSELPLTHHSEGATHVSVFPKGVPTEGLFGTTAETEVTFKVAANQARDYVLGNGTPFATMAFIPNGPASWEAWGFVFGRVQLGNPGVTCERNGEQISADICDPLMGDTITQSGTVDAEARDITVRMLESFRFTE